MDSPITAHNFNKLFKRIVLAADIANAENMSAHSLRRGFATESARLGSSLPVIQNHGRWRSTKTVYEYIEAGRQFTDNAVNALLFED